MARAAQPVPRQDRLLPAAALPGGLSLVLGRHFAARAWGRFGARWARVALALTAFGSGRWSRLLAARAPVGLAGPRRPGPGRRSGRWPSAPACALPRPLRPTPTACGSRCSWPRTAAAFLALATLVLPAFVPPSPTPRRRRRVARAPYRPEARRSLPGPRPRADATSCSRLGWPAAERCDLWAPASSDSALPPPARTAASAARSARCPAYREVAGYRTSCHSP